MLEPHCRSCGHAEERQRYCDNLCSVCAAIVRARRVPCLEERARLEIGLFDTVPVEVDGPVERIVYQSPGTGRPTYPVMERRQRLARHLLTAEPMRRCEIIQLLGTGRSNVDSVVNWPWFVRKNSCWSLTDAGRAALEQAEGKEIAC